MQFFNRNHSSSAASPGSGMPQLRWKECGATPEWAQHPKRVLRRQTQEESSPRCAGKQEPEQLKSTCCIYCNAADPFAFELPVLFAPSQLVFQDWQEHGDAHTHQSCQRLWKTELLMLNMCCTRSATNPLQDLQGSAPATG